MGFYTFLRDEFSQKQFVFMNHYFDGLNTYQRLIKLGDYYQKVTEWIYLRTYVENNFKYLLKGLSFGLRHK